MAKLVALLTLSVAVLAPSIPAQIVVDPNGGGQFTDLQPALDSAPPDAVIKVIGGSYGPIVIRKPVTIVGAPQPAIASPYRGIFTQPDAVSLQGAGTGIVALVNLRLVNRTDYSSWNRGGSPIAGSGFDELRVIDCTVTAPRVENPTGNVSYAVPGIGVGVARVIVARSTVTGGETYSCPGSSYWPTDGGTGIQAPQSIVTVLDSTVLGGNVADFVVWFGPPYTQPCPCPFSGAGGTGIDASTLLQAGSTMLGGSGAIVYYSLTGSSQKLPWGKQPDGLPYRAGTILPPMPNLVVPQPATLGLTYDVYLYSPFRSGGVIAVGGVGVPLSLPFGSLFIDPQAVYAAIALPSNSSLFSLPIPNVASLGGFPFALQHLDMQLGLSRPAVEVVRF